MSEVNAKSKKYKRPIWPQIAHLVSEASSKKISYQTCGGRGFREEDGPGNHNLNKLGKGTLGDAKYHKRPKMGLYRLPDIHWYHGQEYGLEDFGQNVGHQCANKHLQIFSLLTYFLTGPTHIRTLPRYYQYKHSEQV